MPGININNDIGAMRRAIVHVPGREAGDNSLVGFEQAFQIRASFGRSAFDYQRAAIEHESLTTALAEQGVELVTMDDLLCEALNSSPKARREFCRDYASQSGSVGTELQRAITDFLMSSESNAQLIQRALDGVTYGEAFPDAPSTHPLLQAMDAQTDSAAQLAIPLATAYFTKDPVIPVGGGAALCKMYWPERAREALFFRTILTWHPDFQGTSLWSDEMGSYHIEGGDVMRLGPTTIAIGVSDRTEPAAAQALADTLLWDANIEKVLVLRVPSRGRRLHLDTFLSRVDVDSFLVSPELEGLHESWQLTRGRRKHTVRVEALTTPLASLLGQATGNGVCRLICLSQSASSATSPDSLSASNLALAPGKLCVLKGNNAVNETLSAAGMDLVEIALDELTYGFGGPDSLVLPIWREDL